MKYRHPNGSFAGTEMDVEAMARDKGPVGRGRRKWAECEKRLKDYANVSFTNLCSGPRKGTMTEPTCSLAVMS